MKNKSTSLDYKKLLYLTVKEKYFNLILGMFISLLISSFIYQTLAKNFTFKVSLGLPKINEKINKPIIPTKSSIKTYTVLPGDDLWHIAEKFYGSGHNAFDISDANKIDPNIPIEAGQKLIIPDVSRKEPTIGEITATSTSQVTYTEEKYTVKRGDSLSSIALKVYGDLYNWPRLLKANRLTDPDQIEVGMVLVIPR